MTQFIPSVDSFAVADSLAELLAGQGDMRPSDNFFERDWSSLWSNLEIGEWFEIGLQLGRYGSPDFALAELLPVVETWGRFLVPLPFSEACVSRMLGRTSCAIGVSVAPNLVWATMVDRIPGSTDVDLPPLQVDEFAPSRPFGCYDSSMISDTTGSLIVLWAAEAVGCARVVLSKSIEYSKERQAYGRLIGSFQAVRNVLVDMHRDVELAETGLYWAAEDSAKRREVALHSLNLSRRAVESGIQVYGGMGFTWEAGLHYYLRHIVVLEGVVKKYFDAGI